MSWLSELFFWTGNCSFSVNVRNRYRSGDCAWKGKGLGDFFGDNLDSFCGDYL